MRVALNAEQLCQPVPGGTGRYTATLAARLPEVVPGDVVVPFVARHRRASVEAAWRRFGLDAAGTPPPVVLGLARPLLYASWHLLGGPPLTLWHPRLAACDLVHAPSPAVPPRGRKGLVVTVHDAAFALFPQAYPAWGLRFHRLGAAAAARRADLVITVSHAAADEIAEHTAIPAERLRVVPNGVDHAPVDGDDVARVLARHGLDDRPYVLWVGTLEPRKNVGTLVHAFARLCAASDVPHRLALVGPSGWLDAGIVSEADRSALGERLRLLGHVDEAELRALYAGAELFCLPSLHEGFGLPVLEAMVQGIPVVCADVPALREVSGGAARLVSPTTDVEAWSDALADLLDTAPARADLADKGLHRAAEFSWDRTVVATRAVYAEVLGTG